MHESNKKPLPYWTDECTAAVKDRNKAKNKIQQTCDLIEWQAYYKLKGIAQSVDGDAKK